MIASLAFAPGPGSGGNTPSLGLRRARFVRRPGIPLDAACVVANGVREVLRELLGESCAVVLGEPVAVDASLWRALTDDALVFVTPGRATDVAFVLARRDARRLLDAAFREERSPYAAWSSLERDAIERIAARCAVACDVLCAERRGPTRAADPTAVNAGVAFFDIRIGRPLEVTLGVGLLRELAEPMPAASLAPAALADVPVELHAVLGVGELSFRRLLELREGDLVVLQTKVAAAGDLKCGRHRIARGICGAVGGRAAFAVQTVATRGDAP